MQVLLCTDASVCAIAAFVLFVVGPCWLVTAHAGLVPAVHCGGACKRQAERDRALM